MPRHENPGNFDPDAKKQVISTATKKQINATEIKSFWTTYTTTKSISFHTGTKSTSKSRTEIKSIWTIHRKPSQFWCLSYKQVILGQHTSTKSIPPPTQQSNQFYPYTEINSSSVPHTEINSISTTITKTKSISMFTLKTSIFFRHAHKKGQF